MADKFKLITAAYLLFHREDKVLLSQRANTGFHDGDWGLVSGHHDGEEPMTLCAVREAKEEVGVTILPSDLSLRHVMHRRMEDERVDFFFECTSWTGEIANAEPEKCTEVRWFLLNSLPDNTIPYIRQAIESWQRSEVYSEFWKPE